MPVVPTLRRWRQEHEKVSVIIGYMYVLKEISVGNLKKAKLNRQNPGLLLLVPVIKRKHLLYGVQEFENIRNGLYHYFNGDYLNV